LSSAAWLVFVQALPYLSPCRYFRLLQKRAPFLEHNLFGNRKNYRSRGQRTLILVLGAMSIVRERGLRRLLCDGNEYKGEVNQWNKNEWNKKSTDNKKRTTPPPLLSIFMNKSSAAASPLKPFSPTNPWSVTPLYPASHSDRSILRSSPPRPAPPPSIFEKASYCKAKATSVTTRTRYHNND